MTFRPMLALLMALSVTVAASAQSAADMGATKPRKESTLPLQPTPVEADAAFISARFLTRFHYDAQPLDDAMSLKIYNLYFKLLDGEKVFFTQQDMANFAKYKDKLDDAIWNRDLSAPFDIYNQYILRAIDRMNYARSLLKQGFDFNSNDSYTIDRKNADWPKDQAELNDLWRKRTMNDWLRLKLAGKSDDDIRKTLDKRYSYYISRMKQADSEDAFQAFMTAYSNSTDPHTDYMAPRDAENFDIQMKLSLEGIGAQLQARDDYTQIASLVPASPAIKSGKLHVGDTVLGVGQGDAGPIVDVVGWRLDDVVNLIRGKKDTTVRLEIAPADQGADGKHMMVTLVRQKINIQEQAAKSKIIDINEGGVNRKIGVIDLPIFYSDFGARSEGDPDFKSASRDVAKLLVELKAKGVQGIVIDLRNNGGGSLYEADELTGLFIDQGPAVQVRAAGGAVQAQPSKDDASPMTWSGPMAVLVNRGTASASEIFSAAIQDYGRGLVIGSPTFGKGTVQQLIDLNKIVSDPSSKDDFGALKMTSQEFFRINGGSTQLRGVTPDIQFPGNGDDKDFGESTYDNALPWTQIPPAEYKPVADMKAYLPQLQQMHEARDAKSPAWQLMLDELAAYKKLSDRTSISLNFDQRQTERKQLDAMQAEFRARHKAIDGDTTAGADDSQLDDGLNPNERSLKSELKEEDEAKKAPDPQLQETAHVLYDAIGLIDSNPKLATQVLPYGGKEGYGPAVAAVNGVSPRNTAGQSDSGSAAPASSSSSGH